MPAIKRKQKRRKARGGNGTVTGAAAHRVDLKFTKHDLNIVQGAVRFQAELVERMLVNGDVPAGQERRENLAHAKDLRRIGLDLLALQD